MNLSEPAAIIIVCLLGAAVGSFLNVVILRTKDDRPWLTGRSACPHCKKPLGWWELIPLASFLALAGRCRSCRHRLSWQYPLVESLTAAVFLVCYLALGQSWSLTVGWLVSAGLILVAVYDARWALIPDQFTIYLALAAAAWTVAVGHAGWLDHLYGAALGLVFFGGQYWLSRRRWVGSGDILLGGALGLLLGWRMLGLALMISYMAGAIVAAVLILARRAKTNSTIPFGPYLVAGTFVTWLYGQAIVDWYFNHAIFK